jgi:hypothetical protein
LNLSGQALKIYCALYGACHKEIKPDEIMRDAGNAGSLGRAVIVVHRADRVAYRVQV